MPTVVFNPQKEINDLRAEISSLRVQIMVLKKSADYHKSQDCIDIQNAICRQRDELSADNARLREERPQIDYVIDSHGITHRSFTLVYKTRAALAEKEPKT